MKKLEAKAKIEELTKQLEYHNYRYNVLDDPEIGDHEYDLMLKELAALESEFPELALPNSPTTRIGALGQSSFEKVTHAVKMGSLSNVFSFEELQEFDSRVKAECPRADYIVEPKIDGLSVCLEYKNGSFVRGSTRGDGITGEDVTENLRTIKSIPLRLSRDIELLEVRGEVFMPFKVFEKLIKQQEENGEAQFKNPRNAAAGSLRQKDVSVTAARGLDILVFNIERVTGAEVKTHLDSLALLRELGFNAVGVFEKHSDIGEVFSLIEQTEKNRMSNSFGIDGAVVKVNDFTMRERLGETIKYPKWATAFKFKPEEKQTTLNDVELNVGRTGAVTPTAVFTPVLLAGTTVSRAVLHNQDIINALGVNIGDEIIVRKAGDIIPEVVRVTAKHSEGSYQIPAFCPACHSATSRIEGEAVIRCSNIDCPSQLLRNIIHFASRDAMNIDGLGPAIVAALVERKLISSASDLYYLKPEDISALDKMGEKSAQNLLNAIEQTKSNHLSRLVFALGIRNIGQRAAQLLCQRFYDIELLFDATVEQIQEIDGFGYVMAKSVVDFFAIENTRHLVDRLKNAGVNTASNPEKPASAALEGLTFVITGTLGSMSRGEAKVLIEKNSGKVAASVSSKTNYLVAGEDGGSKLEKAAKLGVEIIDEQALLKMLQ